MTKFEEGPPEMPGQSSKGRVREELARWTHLWLAAAVSTLEHLESIWDEEDPVRSLGRRDALSLVVIDAVRNVYRGGLAVLGPEDSNILAFEERAGGMKDLRDRLEHFDSYLEGRGFAQTGGYGRPPLALDGAIGLRLVMSAGGGPGGHTITVAVVEAHGNEEEFVFESRSVVDAARRLGGACLEAAGLMDERHRERCSTCHSQMTISEGQPL